MLQLKEITKRYTTGSSESEVLKGISLTIEEGELVSIMGASGSGKSTLMNIIGMLDLPSSGHFQFDDIDVLKADDDTLAALRNHKVGFIFQSFNLLPRLNAIENICLPLGYRGISFDRAKPLAQEMLEKVGLPDHGLHKPTEMSGGQRQRVAIARALITQPSILLADEPTGALDSETGQAVMDMFVALNAAEKLTTVVVTHDPKIAQQCHRLLVIHDGLLIEDKRQS